MIRDRFQTPVAESEDVEDAFPRIPETFLADRKTQTSIRSLSAMWHLLSLDAPLVATAWTYLLGWSVNAPPTLVQAGALALAVWMLYALDRLLDAIRGKGQLEERHRFHHRHRRPFTIALVLALPLLCWLVFALPGQLRHAWMLLGLPLAVYFLLIHLTPLRLPKEFAVALFFAAACSVPAEIHASLAAVLPSGLLFALLCWTNCIAIARWESDAQRLSHPMTRWGIHHLRGLCLGTLLGALAVFLLTAQAAVPLAAAVSALALLAADVSWRPSAPRLQMRILADAVLLTPLALVADAPTLREQTIAHLLTVLPHLHAAALR